MTASLNSSSENGLYEGAERFTQTHSKITWREFEQCLLGELKLFDVPGDEYLEYVEKTIDAIIRALPHFERIFKRPIIRLKDEHKIVTVEAVKIIDRASLTHLAAHCELWEDITEDEGIKPRKLMTIENVETYSIYENTVFACAVDTILSFIRQNMLIMQDVFFCCKDFHLNLLDRTHHSRYFLALGKLYLEYIRSGVSLEKWASCIDKMLFVEKTIRLRLKAPVYQKCKARSYNITLKKTNIFRSHKDYKEIYNIMHLFQSKKEDEKTLLSLHGGDEEYKSFCRLITLFAAGHFDYNCDNGMLIALDKLRFTAAFRGWKLSVREISHGGMTAFELKTKKDTEYTSCMIVGSKNDIAPEELDSFERSNHADEYLFCSPEFTGDMENIHLSLFDVDSFRRIQQILLRGRIYTDMQQDRCAFCGDEVIRTDRGYVCRSCQASVEKTICPSANKEYYISTLTSRTIKMDREKRAREKRQFLHDRYNEAQLHFRNITAINELGDLLCPICGVNHP